LRVGVGVGAGVGVVGAVVCTDAGPYLGPGTGPYLGPATGPYLGQVGCWGWGCCVGLGFHMRVGVGHVVGVRGWSWGAVVCLDTGPYLGPATGPYLGPATGPYLGWAGLGVGADLGTVRLTVLEPP
jgi:hypothetical protein